MPHPWSAAVCVTAEPIHVPEKIGKDQLEHYRLKVENAMNEATEAAERIVSRRSAGEGQQVIPPLARAAG